MRPKKPSGVKSGARKAARPRTKTGAHRQITADAEGRAGPQACERFDSGGFEERDRSVADRQRVGIGSRRRRRRRRRALDWPSVGRPSERCARACRSGRADSARASGSAGDAGDDRACPGPQTTRGSDSRQSGNRQCDGPNDSHSGGRDTDGTGAAARSGVGRAAAERRTCGRGSIRALSRAGHSRDHHRLSRDRR